MLKTKLQKKWKKTMFNFKEGSKRKILKVKYFKKPNMAFHFYDRHLAAYGRLPRNDKISIYFENLFYAFWE